MHILIYALAAIGGMCILSLLAIGLIILFASIPDEAHQDEINLH